MADTLVFPGKVEWSGENPGISLKEAPDGPFVALASFFRVVLSPHGRGHALVFATSDRPVRSARGWSAAPMRHGVSVLRSGHRLTLGLIFHDAK